MFYTLASKLLIKGPAQGRDFLMVFIAGSVMYVALHWYLHLDQKTGIVEQVKKYLYYAMAVDLAVAYVMCTFFAPAVKNEDESEDKSKTKREYTDDEKKAIMAKMQEARRQQMKKTQQAQNPEQAQQAGGPGGPPGMLPQGPPIDPRTGLPMGMDPRVLLSMDPKNPPPGVDPRIIQQVQMAHSQRLQEAANDEDEEDEESEISEPKKAKKSKSKGKSNTPTDDESEKQEKRSIFSRSEEAKTDTPEDETPEPPKRVRVKAKDKGSISSDKQRETGSDMEDTEIPMFA